MEIVWTHAATMSAIKHQYVVFVPTQQTSAQCLSQEPREKIIQYWFTQSFHPNELEVFFIFGKTFDHASLRQAARTDGGRFEKKCRINYLIGGYSRLVFRELTRQPPSENG